MKLALRFLSSYTLIVFVSAQLGGNIFEIFEYTNGGIRPLSSQYVATTPRYQENIFFNRQDNNLNNERSTDLQGCDSYWTIQNDFNGAYGQLMIPTKERTEIKLRAVLSVGARLPSVR